MPYFSKNLSLSTEFEGENLLYQSFFLVSNQVRSLLLLHSWSKQGEKCIRKKSREDILKDIEKHGWTAFSDMKYLDKFVAEGTRIYPPVSTIDRFTTKDYQVIIFVI